MAGIKRIQGDTPASRSLRTATVSDGNNWGLSPFVLKKPCLSRVFFAHLAKVSRSNRSPEPCDATHCGTPPQFVGVSHINPQENVFSLGLAWDTLAGIKVFCRIVW